MKNKIDNKRLLGILTLVFMGCFILFGSRTYTDTTSYEVMSPIREPGYAVFLYFFRKLFGQYAYVVVALFQNILAIVANYLLLSYIMKMNRLDSVAIKLILLIAVLMPYIFTPVFSATHLFIANAVLTEGVTLSLYNLYIYCLLHIVWEKDAERSRYVYYSVLSMFIVLLLMLTRGQMLVTLIVWVIVQVAVLYVQHRQISKKQGLRNLVLILALLVMALFSRKILVGTYNYINNGHFAATPYSKVTLFSNVLYVSKAGLGEKIEDDTLRQLYDQIYQQAKEQKVLYCFAPEGFKEEAVFFAEAHDIIKMDIVEKTLAEYVETQYTDVDYLQRLMILDRLSNDMMKATLPQCLPEYIGHYFKNVLVGLIRSVAILHPLLYFPVLAGYLFLIAMGIYLGIKDKKSKAFIYFLLTVLMTAGMVGAVSLTIMCLSRYMIYNTTLIYTCGILMIGEILKKKKEESNHGL